MQPAVTSIDPSGGVHMGAPIVAPELAVDAALSADGQWLALVGAGTPDPNLPLNFGGSPFAPSLGAITIIGAEAISASSGANDCASGRTIPVPGQTTAVSFNPNQL